MTIPAPADEMAAINALRADEGDSVMIFADNPDFPPYAAIEVCGAWTNWKERRFVGPTLAEALATAVAARAGDPQWVTR